VADPGFYVGRGENPKIKSEEQKNGISLKIENLAKKITK